MNRNQKKRRWYAHATEAVACLLLAALLAFPSLSAYAVADTTENDLSVVHMDTRATNVSLTYGGKTLSVSAQRYGGQLMVPLAAFARQFTSASYRYDTASGYAYLSAPGLAVSAGHGGSFITANDRPLWGYTTNRIINNTMWVPLSPLAKAMGLTVAERNGRVTISGSYRALTPASAFYREDEVYWLSRIISAESRGEPLTGQMAVGSVILNRVRSSQFPNTIWGVIFQKDQFSPVKNGSVHKSPAWSSVIAAKLCLEGYTIDNNILFFCNTSVSPYNWITQNRRVAFKIGGHTFYY